MIVDLPPAAPVVSQLPRFQSDVAQGCPGYSPQQNMAVGLAANNHLASMGVQQGRVTILFTREFRNFSNYQGGIDQQEAAKLDRFLGFIQSGRPGEYRYIFFCPHPEDTQPALGFIGDSWQQIARLTDVFVRSYQDFFNQFGIQRISTFNRGTLYYVLPR